MPAAARIGDATNHPGVISGPGAANVLIGGQPAAVTGDAHVCSWPSGHPPSTMIGTSSVLIGGRPAVMVGDSSGCGAEVIPGPFALSPATVLLG